MIYQCPKCRLLKSTGVMNSVLPQCECDWGAPAAQKNIQRLSALVRAQQITIDKLEAQRQWVGLTDEEIDEWTPEIHVVIRAVEAKLKEKNT